MVAFAGALAGAARLAPAAQDRVPHLAFPWLGAAGSGGDALKGLLSGLRDLGYQEGRNLVIDYYYAGGDPARLAELATAAVALHPDVIVTSGGLTTTALAKATRTIPIVSVNGDPVGMGFATSLAHPGGNITGLSVYVSNELAGKLDPAAPRDGAKHATHRSAVRGRARFEGPRRHDTNALRGAAPGRRRYGRAVYDG